MLVLGNCHQHIWAARFLTREVSVNQSITNFPGAVRDLHIFRPANGASDINHDIQHARAVWQ